MEKKDIEDITLLKILIAEDDQVNQLVAKIIFKQIGCHYDLVENGLQAIEKLREGVYDLVLMDIEMPEMDGYQATVEIRKNFSTPVNNVPILAITSHMSEIELNKCMDAGMNGYIFKPLKLNDLVEKMNSIFGFSKDNSIPEKNKQKDVNKAFNLKNLYASCSDNPVTVKNIIKLFIAQTPGNLGQLQQLLQKGDWDSLKNLCHKIKAVFALIGAEEVRKYLNEIEEDCIKNNINVAKFEHNITAIQNLSDILLRELQETELY